MLIKKETSKVVKISLDETEKSKLKNYSRGITDHCTFELVEGVYFVFCKSANGLLKYNGRYLFIGELEATVRQETNCYDDIVVKYCCDNSKNVGTVLSNNCLIRPMFFNNEMGYDYFNNTLYCFNIA